MSAIKGINDKHLSGTWSSLSKTQQDKLKKEYGSKDKAQAKYSAARAAAKAHSSSTPKPTPTPSPSSSFGSNPRAGMTSTAPKPTPTPSPRPSPTPTPTPSPSSSSSSSRSSSSSSSRSSSSSSSSRSSAPAGRPTNETYNQAVKNLSDTYSANNPNAGMVKGQNSMMQQFDKDGYLSYDSEKAMYQSSNTLKQMGYKAGDTLWKPGTRDELNGRVLTGRIARITANGNYIPEYENEAANSAFKGSGFKGWQGEVGLGADQAAYNKSMPNWAQGATDPRTGEAMQNSAGNQNQQEQYYAQQNADQNVNKSGPKNDLDLRPAMNHTNGFMDFNYKPEYDMPDYNSYTNKKKTSGSRLNENFVFDPFKFTQGQ